MRLPVVLLLLSVTLLDCYIGLPVQKSKQNDHEEMPILEPVARATRATSRDLRNELMWSLFRDASIEYGQPLYPFERNITKQQATRVRAIITKVIVDFKFGSSSYGVPDFPPGFLKLREDGKCPHRGHLLAKELGGSGTDVRNIVTLTELANIKSMRPWEDKVAKAWNRNLGDLCMVRYSVDADYKRLQLHPKSIRIKAEVVNRFTNQLIPWFHVQFSNDPVPPPTEHLHPETAIRNRIECTPTPSPWVSRVFKF